MQFEPYAGETEKEDPWWSRLFLYVFGTAILAAACAIVVFFQQSGVGSESLARRNVADTEKANQRILLYTKIAGGIGAVAGAAISIKYEFKTRKEPAGC